MARWLVGRSQLQVAKTRGATKGNIVDSALADPMRGRELKKTS
jgi:hypothetical protein